MKKTAKQRMTAFIDPTIVKRAKVRAALEEITISQLIEKALDVYTPLIKQVSDNQIYLKSTIKIPSQTRRSKQSRNSRER